MSNKRSLVFILFFLHFLLCCDIIYKNITETAMENDLNKEKFNSDYDKNYTDEENKDCDDYCDLDRNKICDNCGKCIECYKNYKIIKITKIIK